MEGIRKDFYTTSTQAKKQQRKPVSQISKQTTSSLLLVQPSSQQTQPYIEKMIEWNKGFIDQKASRSSLNQSFQLQQTPTNTRKKQYCKISEEKQSPSKISKKSLTFEQLVNLDSKSLVQTIFDYTDKVKNLEHYVMSLQQDLQDHVDDERPHNEFVTKEDTSNIYQEIECDIVRIYEQMGTDFLKYENAFQQITGYKRDKENQRDEKKQ